jgi:transposase-like protein
VNLPPRQARVLELTAQGVPVNVIAEQLGIKRSTVYTTLARARQRTRRKPVPCERCGEDPAVVAGLCGFCHEELAQEDRLL